MGNTTSLSEEQIEAERWKLQNQNRKTTPLEEEILKENAKRLLLAAALTAEDETVHIPWNKHSIHGLYEPRKEKGVRIKDKLFATEKEKADAMLKKHAAAYHQEEGEEKESLKQEKLLEPLREPHLVSIIPQPKTKTIMITATNCKTNLFYTILKTEDMAKEMDTFIEHCDLQVELTRQERWELFMETLAEVMRLRYFELSKPVAEKLSHGSDIVPEDKPAYTTLALKVLDGTVAARIIKAYQLEIKLHRYPVGEAPAAENGLTEQSVAHHSLFGLIDAHQNALDTNAAQRAKLKNLEAEIESLKATNSALQRRCTKLQIIVNGNSQYNQLHEIPSNITVDSNHNSPRSTPSEIDFVDDVKNPEDESGSDTDDTNEFNEPFMLPISRVLQILQRWKTRKNLSRHEFNSISYIISVIQNDALYEVDVNRLAQRENDKEMKKWIRTEFSARRSERASVVLMIKAYAKALTFARILTETVLKTRVRKPAKLTRQPSRIKLPDRVSECIANIDTVEFDVFQLNEVSDGHPLYFVGLYLFEHYGLIRRFNIKISVLRNFLNVIESGYLNNPYHNKLHVTDVLQTLHYLIRQGDMKCFLSDLDIFSLIVSAIVHDYAHPGVNNAFEIRAKSENALLYNDQSVLENYHLTNTFRLMKQPPFNIFAEMDQDEARTVRANVIQTVLSTDVSRHFAVISQVRASILKKFNKGKQEDVGTLCKLLLKCADVSNPTKPRRFAQKWADMITNEFYLQGDKERSHAWNVSPFMDRTHPNKAQCQVGFIQYIVRPLFDSLAQFEPSCMSLVEQMNANESYWKELVEAQRVQEEEAASHLKIRDMHRIQEVHPESEEEEEENES